MKTLTIIRVGTVKEDYGIMVIPKKLETFQELVGGYIEHVYFQELRKHKIVMVANEEGLLRGLDLNENLEPFFYVGQTFFTGLGDEDLEDLTFEQQQIVNTFLERLKEVR